MKFSSFDVSTLLVESDFTATPDVADLMMADGYGFPEVGKNEIVTDGVVIGNEAAQQMLQHKLKASKNLFFGSKDSAASRRTDYPKANLCGGSNHCSLTSMDLKLQHKERGLENVWVTSELEESKKREEMLLKRLRVFELTNSGGQSNGTPR